MKIKCLVRLSAVLVFCLTVLSNPGIQSKAFGQGNTAAPQYISLLKRVDLGGKDNYTQAAFSFKYGINGDASLATTRNNWDLLFGNSPTPDAFDVHMVGDDCSRIKDLGAFNWTDNFKVPALPAYQQPTREPSVPAIVGHMYLVHNKDSKSDHYALFRVESLEPGVRVTISWKLIPAPAPTQ